MTDATNEIETPEAPVMTRSTRDGDELRANLTAWLGRQLHDGAAPTVPELGSNSANGMSSETVLFTASWADPDGGSVTEELVARIAPDTDNEPVFPEYELGNQYELLREVGRLTDGAAAEDEGTQAGRSFHPLAAVEINRFGSNLGRRNIRRAANQHKHLGNPGEASIDGRPTSEVNGI